MIIAFWNVNTGTGSFPDREQTIHTWCGEVQPEIVFFEEISFTMTKDHLNQITGFQELARASMLDVNLDQSTKDVVGLGDSDDFTGRTLRFPGLAQKRMLVKVTQVQTDYPGLAIWGIHANASVSGGSAAVQAVTQQLQQPSGAGTVVGGDFNCSINNVGQGVHAVHPLNHLGQPLPFTQWRKEAGSTPKGTYFNKKVIHQKIVPNPHGVIDYVVHGPNRKVNALPNCHSPDTWDQILAQFDHCPVVYRITG